MRETQSAILGYGDIIVNDGQLGPFPMHRLKHVEKPTTLITDNIERADSRETAFDRAARGDYGEAVRGEMLREKKEPLVAAQMDILRYVAEKEDNEVAASKAPLPEDTGVVSRHIKCLGYYLKADIMGICRFPQSAAYSLDYEGKPINIDYPYAIVIIVSKDYGTVTASTGYDWIVDSISFQAYQRAAIIAQVMADYIRRLGYRASAQHAGRYDILIPPLLLHAGIGEVSRTGIILNPFLGLNFKAAAVLTDLPLVPDKPIDFGLQEYCQSCNICAELCPSQAIPRGDKVIYNGYETWKLDERRCASFFLVNKDGIGCGRCVKVCPFTRPYARSQNIKNLDFDSPNLAGSLAAGKNNPSVRGRENKKKKWWFDLENVDGTLRIAGK